jgi:hypothetical protein
LKENFLGKQHVLSVKVLTLSQSRVLSLPLPILMSGQWQGNNSLENSTRKDFIMKVKIGEKEIPVYLSNGFDVTKQAVQKSLVGSEYEKGYSWVDTCNGDFAHAIVREVLAPVGTDSKKLTDEILNEYNEIQNQNFPKSLDTKILINGYEWFVEVVYSDWALAFPSDIKFEEIDD